MFNIDFSLTSSLNLQSFFKNRISQMTSIFLLSEELFGMGGPLDGALFFIGTISIDIQKHQETKKETSRNKNRIIIKGIVSENPGITLREIQRTSNLAMGVIQYHIHYLESGEKSEIESLKFGRSKHFFLSSSCFSTKEKVWFSLNRNQNIKNILDLVGYKHCTQKDLSISTGNSKSLISYYVKNLVNNGIIEKENNRLRITEDYAELNRNTFCKNA